MCDAMQCDAVRTRTRHSDVSVATVGTKRYLTKVTGGKRAETGTVRVKGMWPQNNKHRSDNNEMQLANRCGRLCICMLPSVCFIKSTAMFNKTAHKIVFKNMSALAVEQYAPHFML